MLRSASRRLVGGIDGETAWGVLERARVVSGATPAAVLAVRGDGRDLAGLSVSWNGMKWRALEVGLYIEDQRDRFSTVPKLMLAADPSTYQGQETMVGLLWSWELRHACYAPVQVMPASSLVVPDELPMSGELMALLLQRKLERVKAYRELQAWSAQLSHVACRTMDDFKIPDNVLWRPVGHEHKNEKNQKK